MVSPAAEKRITAMQARKAAGLGISGQMDVERHRAEYGGVGARSSRADGGETVPADGMVHVWHFFAGAMPEADAAVDALGK